MNPRADAPLLQAAGLSKSFGPVEVLRDIELSVVAGEVHAIIGENGAGKSTLMRLLSGHLQPTRGEVSIDGQAVHLSGPVEAETRGIEKQFGKDKVESVIPSVSLLAEFPVAVVDKVVDKRGSRDLAKSYLDFLYTEQGQRIAAEFGHRVRNEKVAAEFKDKFPPVRLVTVEDTFGGWDKVQKEQFASGAILDKLYGQR